MGLFDNVFKQLDSALNAIESGELEKRLDKIAASVDAKSKQVDSTLAKVADKPSELLRVAEVKTKLAEQTVVRVSAPLRRKIDI